MTYGAAAALLLIAASIATLANLPRLRDPDAPIDRKVWLGLAALVAIQLALVTQLAPFDTWHSNRRGLGFLTDVLTGQLDRPGGLNALHGTGVHTALVLSHRITGGAFTTFQLQLAWSLLGTLAAFWWARAASESSSRALWMTGILVCLPLRLRLAPTDCMYIVPEATWLLGLACLTTWARRRELLWLVLGTAWITYTAHCRTEMLVLAPLSVPLATSAVPGATLALFRTPATWTLTLLAGLSYLPRVWALQNMEAEGGISTVTDGDSALSPLMAVAFEPHLWPLYGLLLWGMFWTLRPATQFTTKPGLRTVAVLSAAWLVVSWWPGLAPQGFDGVDLVLPGILSAGPETHALVDPSFTPLALSLAALLGAAMSLWRGERVTLGILAVTTVAMWIYLPRWDNASTFVRVGLSLAWCAAWCAAALLDHLTRATPAVPRTALAIVLLAAPLPRYADWIAYRFPMQQEHELLELARTLAAEGSVVHMLGPSEVPDGWRLATSDLSIREDVRGYVAIGHPAQVAPMSALLTADDALPRYYLRGLDCHVPLLAWQGSCPEDCTWLYGAGDRLYEGGPPPFESRTGLSALAQLAPRWQLDEQVPCRTRPEQATCLEEDDRGCLRWRCEPVPAPEPAPYLDPACQAVEDAFELSPVAEYPLATGQLSGVLLTPVSHGAVLGLYEVVGRR
jgi:hypothetical protein